MPDVRCALREAVARLAAANVPSATLAAEILLLHVLGRDRAFLYTHPELPLTNDARDQFVSLIARRAAGEPTQYLTGKQEFWGLEFEVTPAVLIPRPETEHVIEAALERIGPRGEQALRLADIGTGSGCLAVALAKELRGAQIVATDISRDALAIAQRNAARHQVTERIRFAESDLLGALRDPVPFDLIASNPPYVARREAPTLQREVREHEPEIALFGGPTGVEVYGRLIAQAGSAVASGGTLVLELGYDSADRVRKMIDGVGVWLNVSITNDLAGIPRVLAATRV